MRFAWLALIVFFVGGVPESQAQTNLFASVSTEEVEIPRLPPMSKNVELDMMRCGGDYFLWEGNPKTIPRGMRTGVLVQQLGSSLQGVFFPKERYRTIFDESKNIPTVEYNSMVGVGVVLRPSNRLPWIFIGEGAGLTVRLSEAEYKKASKCLPEPST